jgi:hypothetical protein
MAVGDDFLPELFRGTKGLIYFCALRNSRSKLPPGEIAHIITRDLDKIEGFRDKWDRPEHECGIYFHTATLKVGADRRIKGNCRQFSALFSDTDDANHELSRDMARALLEQAEYPPTLIVDSGHGLQPYWLLVEPCNDAGRIEKARKAIQNITASDSVADAARVMRLVGSHNCKKGNGEWLNVEIISLNPERRYRLDDLERWLERAPVIIPRKPEEQKPEAKSKPKPKHNNGPRHFYDDVPDIAVVREALRFIPNDDREIWCNIGMALNDAFGDGARGVWDEWSASSAKYNDAGQEKAWRSFAPGGGITIATLFHLAQQQGYHFDDAADRRTKRTNDKQPRENDVDHEQHGGQVKYVNNEETAEAAAAQTQPTVPLFNPWERYIVPEFPLHVLPSVVQGYVTSQSVVIGCDPAALAMATLTAFSGALDHRFAVKMMRNGNWWEHPRLWTLLVGDPSRKKTPIINDVTRPLERHQNDLRRNYEARLRDYETAKKDGEKGVEKPDPPIRYVVWDTTTEKLGEILSRSEHGLLVKRDEFSGWIGGMEKYSNASRGAAADRGFWLQAYDGGPHAVDRVSRGEIYIGNLSVSLIGGVQPARLAEFRGLTSDGLLQRFLPVMMRASSLPQDCESDDWENFHALVYKLVKAKHQRLLLSNGALSIMNDLRAHLHKLEQAAAGLADGLQAFIGKLPGVAGRLAIILHMTSSPDPEFPAREIMLDTIEHVRTLILDFIVPHAVEFYRSTEELTGGERLRKIASWIVTSREQTVTSRELIRNVACLRGVSVFDLHTVVSPLVATGWLEPEQRGPDNRTWTVSPKVAAQFERQRQIEEERKILVAELMGSPRHSTDERDR